MVCDFQPATSISSFSLPPSASQLVAKHVGADGVHGRQPSSQGPVVDDLIDARRRHGPVAAKPEMRQVGQAVPLPGPQIAVECLGGLAADRQDAGPATLTQHRLVPRSPSATAHLKKACRPR